MRLPLLIWVLALIFFHPMRMKAGYILHDKYPYPPFGNKIYFSGWEASADSVVVIPFARAGNLILLSATIDSIRGNFILDTGAPGLVLNLTYFRNYTITTHENENQAGLTTIPESRLTTVIGNLWLSQIEFHKLDADLVSLGHIENAKSVKILGLLGVELFKQFEMIIDYDNNILYLYHISKRKSRVRQSDLLQDSSKYEILKFDLIDNKIITKMTIGGKKLRFIVDSGAESNLLDSRLPNSVFDNVQLNRRVKLLGTGSEKIDALAGDLNNLKAGNIKVDGLPVMITNLEKSCLSYLNCTDGVLGYDFLSLHKIGFNFVKREMYIWK